DGKQYYFDQDGSMHKWTLHDNGKQYYFNEDGSMHTGWLQWNSDKKWAAFDKNGVMYKDTKVASASIPGPLGFGVSGDYYFDKNGALTKKVTTFLGHDYVTEY
ncbi:putative cell wall binding repeat protein, partial [Bacillus sp. 196mf]